MPDKIYRFSNAYISFIMQRFCTWRIEGLENVPKEGGLIIISNHISNFDPPLLSCSIPRRMYFLSKRGIFKPGVAQFLRAFGAYPVGRDGQDLEAFNWSRRILTQGGAVCLFPEARRAPGAKMVTALPGTALLALRARATLLPVAVTGTQHLTPLPRIFFPVGNFTVRIGKPFTLPEAPRIRREQLDALTTSMMLKVAELLPPEYRGVYQLPSGTKPNPSGQSEQPSHN